MVLSLNPSHQVPNTARTELTPEQVGHLRHFANLLGQQSNDWSFMQGKGLGQDDFGGYRFQLAYMTYAMALALCAPIAGGPRSLQTAVRKSDREDVASRSVDLLEGRQPRWRRLQRAPVIEISSSSTIR